MKKYTVLLLTLILSSSLLGCTEQSSTANNNNSSSSVSTQSPADASVAISSGEMEQSPSSSPAPKQGDTATEDQLHAATQVAKQYKQTEYDVQNYKQIHLDDTTVAGDLGLPRVYQQQYEHLQPYVTSKFLAQQITNRMLILPQQLAVQSKANVKATDLKLNADPVFKVKGIMEIDYEMNIMVGDTEKIPFTGTLQLQQNNGEWKVINDAYNQTQLAKLIDRAHGKTAS
jgi:hypothetical protein